MAADAMLLAPRVEFPRREFRAAAEYRRSLLYVTVGGCAITALLWYLPRPANAPLRPEQAAAFSAIFIALPLASWAYISTWRLRVDHSGLWRKRLGAWTCWTWDFIEKERVRYDRRHGFLWCSARPWRDRLLSFAILSPADAAFVLEVFLRLARIPDSEATDVTTNSAATAQRITIRTLRWTRIDFDRKGLEINDGWRTQSHSWDAVSEVRIERIQQQQAVVHRFRIRLNDGSGAKGGLLFVWVDGVQDWTPHQRDRGWLQALRGLVPEGKWRCLQSWGELHDWEEAEWRFAYWNSHRIVFRRVKRYLPLVPPLLLGSKFFPGMWALANAPFFPQPWKAIAILCGVYVVFKPALLFWIIGRIGEQAMETKLKEARAELHALADRQASPLIACS